jgi:hypothetical protein
MEGNPNNKQGDYRMTQDDRKTIRCPHCQLVQFVYPTKQRCNRCKNLFIEPEPQAAASHKIPEKLAACFAPAATQDERAAAIATTARLRERYGVSDRFLKLFGATKFEALREDVKQLYIQDHRKRSAQQQRIKQRRESSRETPLQINA